MGSTTGNMNAACPDFNEEQNIDCVESQGFDGEEITGEELISVMIEKSAPRKPAVSPLWSRGNAMASQDVANRDGINAVAQLEEFAADPFVSPAQVLLCHLQNQALQVFGKRWTSRFVGISKCPFASDEFPVPTQNGFWAKDEEHIPQLLVG